MGMFITHLRTFLISGLCDCIFVCPDTQRVHIQMWPAVKALVNDREFLPPHLSDIAISQFHNQEENEGIVWVKNALCRIDW
jgi:hypothetical protein